MQKSKKNKKKWSFYDYFSMIIIVLGLILCIFPLYWLLVSSFKHPSDILKMPPDLFPVNGTLQNYVEVFVKKPALRWTFNSVFVSFGTTLLVVIVSSLAAYAFAKLDFYGKNAIFTVFIATLMIPKEIMIVPMFKIINSLHWMNTYKGIILPNVATAFGVFLLKQFMETIPDALRESAKLDGCSEFQTFIKIILPIAKPGIGALFILNFVTTWNDYLWQLVMSNSDQMKTLMVGIASMMDEIDPNIAYKMAGAVVAAVPMLLMFIFFQGFFTKGITIGAVKE